MTASVTWSGYEPWADTVAAARREFVSLARTFWLIPEIIPPVTRDDVSLLYCFCRHLDDAVDENPDAAAARAELARWRDELFGRAPARPLIAAFLACAARTGLPLESADHLLDGMAADLGTVRLADDDALLRYAYQVSSSVGLMLAPLLGVHGEAALWRVIDLGVALQVSNILVGVRGDAARGRVYLPATRLAAEGLTAGDVLADPAGARLRPVLRGLAALGDAYYRSAELGATLVPLRYRHGVLLLSRVYGALGRRATRPGAAAEAPARMPTLEKARQLGEMVRAALHPHLLGIVRPPPHDAALHRAFHGWPAAHG
jgi:phytoene synthase